MNVMLVRFLTIKFKRKVEYSGQSKRQGISMMIKLVELKAGKVFLEGKDHGGVVVFVIW